MHTTLAETIPGMVAGEFKARLVAEYEQLVIRLKGLEQAVLNYDPNVFSCPKGLLEAQLGLMRDLSVVLKARIDMELSTEDRVKYDLI